MSTSVVILAQGDQKRLPDLRIPKQLLALPACGKTPILDRTLRMVYEIASVHPMVVGWPHFVDHYTIHPVRATPRRTPRELLINGMATVRPIVVTLEKPGNSSIKGIYQVFQQYKPRTDRVVVLLGDVIYQWSVLEELLGVGPGVTGRDVIFSVSDNLSPSGGELWGIAWNKIAAPDIMEALTNAHRKQPYNNDVYQNGQMRLWLWDLEAGTHALPGRCRHVTDAYNGDYITDIDLPAHATPEFLIPLSELAAADDAAHGVTW